MKVYAAIRTLEATCPQCGALGFYNAAQTKDGARVDAEATCAHCGAVFTAYLFITAHIETHCQIL